MSSGYFDAIRFELFEKLLPELLYKGSAEVRSELLHSLRERGRDFIFSVLYQMAEDDGKKCPYSLEDFYVKNFDYNGIRFIQMDLPPCNSKINDIVRTYILCSGDSDLLYFIIKRFREGRTFILYATPELQVLKSEELTAHTDDRNYEYQALSEIYRMVIQREQPDVAQGYWSRDWSKVDWHSVRDKIQKGEQDIGISEEEYLELMRWCATYHKEFYDQTLFYLALKEHDLPDDSARYIAAHPDQFRQMLECFEK